MNRKIDLVFLSSLLASAVMLAIVLLLVLVN